MQMIMGTVETLMSVKYYKLAVNLRSAIIYKDIPLLNQVFIKKLRTTDEFFSCSTLCSDLLTHKA